MTMIPAFGPWTEHPADTDEEKRLASAQQSKTSPLSVDKEHETGVFYGSGKEPYQTSLASCTCNDFVKRKKPCKHIFRLAMELGIIDAAYKTGRSTGERNEAQISFADSVALVEQLSDAAQNAIKDMLYYTSERIDDPPEARNLSRTGSCAGTAHLAAPARKSLPAGRSAERPAKALCCAAAGSGAPGRQAKTKRS